MNAMRDRASVAPSTVTRLSRGEVPTKKRKRGDRLLAVLDSHVVKVDERIMAHLNQAGVDFRYVEVINPTEVIVHNQRVR